MKRLLIALGLGMVVLSGWVVLACLGFSDWLSIDVAADDGPALQGSGRAASVERSPGAFDRIVLRSAVRLEVQVGEPGPLRLSGDDNLLERIETRVEGRTLWIESSGSYYSRTPMQIEVRTPGLSALVLQGSADARIRGAAGDALELVLDGSGTIEVSGRVAALDAQVNGSGDIVAADLQARSVEVEINGSGDATVTATASLDAEVNGSGDIRYHGAPAAMRSRVRGSGDIERVD